MYTQAEREIYQFVWRGETRYADPLYAWRAIHAQTRGRYNEFAEAMKADRASGDPNAAQEAAEAIYAAGLVAFGLPAFSPKSPDGALRREVFDILNDFMEYIERGKASGANSPSSSPTTDSRRVQSPTPASSPCNC